MPRSKRRRSKVRTRRAGALLALAGALLLPTLGVIVRAHADDADEEGETAVQIAARQRHIIATLATDPSVLINVSARDMPASPDILNLGKRSTGALERCLSDNANAALRGYCADLLGSLGDRRALGTMDVALEDWDPSVRYHVIRALADIPDASSVPLLAKLLTRKDETDANRGVILTTLGSLSDKRAVKLLADVLHHDKDHRGIAFAALWHSRHLVARGELVGHVAFALGTDDPGLTYQAVLAAAALHASPLVKPLLPLLEHSNADIRNKAAYALGKIGDKSATKALLALLPTVRDARMLNNISFALERLDRPAFFAQIQRLIQHKQAIIRLNATFVVGDVRKADGLPLLEKALADPSNRVKSEAIVALEKLERVAPVNPLFVRALGDPSDAVKSEAIMALGRAGTKAEIPALEGFTTHKKLWLREDAVYAVHALSGKTRGNLIFDKLFSTPDDGVRRRAAIALGEVGDSRVRDYLLECMERRQCAEDDVDHFVRTDKDPAVPGRILLDWARQREDLGVLVAALRPQGASMLAASNVQLAMVQRKTAAIKRGVDLVADLGDASMAKRIAPVAAATDTWLRVHGQVAMARLGDRGAEVALLGELDSFATDWLPALSRAFERIHEPAVRARLAPELARREASPDVAIALAAAAIRLDWQPAAAFPRLYAGLAADSVRERDLAQRYLTRGLTPPVEALLQTALGKEKREDVRERIARLLDRSEP